jgi:hypothetical protein
MNRQKLMDLIGGVVLLGLAGVLSWKATHFKEWSTLMYVGAAGCVLYALFCFWRGLFRSPPDE